MKRRFYVLLVILVGASVVSAQQPLTPAFSYQGRLDSGGAPASGSFDLRFELYPDASTGSPIGAVVAFDDLIVEEGLFTVELDFGSSTFDGERRWLEVSVRLGASIGAFTTLNPRQELRATPYALHASRAPWAGLTDVPADIADGDNDTVRVAGTGLVLAPGTGTMSVDEPYQLPQGCADGKAPAWDTTGSIWICDPAGPSTLDGAYDGGGSGAGKTITVDSGAVTLNVTNASSGLSVTSSNVGNTFSAIHSTTNSSVVDAAAILGVSWGTASGIKGQISIPGTAEQAVLGRNFRTTGGSGVRGEGFHGVVGVTSHSTGFAVYGENLDAVLPLGNGVGVVGRGYYGILGEDRYSGAVAGAYAVYANGNFGATGTKTFRIDHPLDPENRYLRHNSVESDEILNMYRGTAPLDGSGSAWIELPSYFEAVNRQFSYHLTPIGAAASLYIAETISDNRFRIAGGEPNMSVSWLVIAERNDVYLQMRPHLRAAEIKKPESEQGRFLIPSDYGEPPERGVFQRQMDTQRQKDTDD